MSLISNNISFKSGNITDNQTEQHNVVQQPLSANSANNLERTPVEGDCIDFLMGQNKRPTIFSVFVKPVLNKITEKVTEHNQKKEIKELNKTCERLIDNLKETQKTFQDVFMRKDITEHETLEIIKRYHDIEILGITGTKEDYINALFDEAKRNYGFENLPNDLKIVNGAIGDNQKTLGATNPLGDITIRGDLTRKLTFNTIHHELRHVKQNQYAFNYDPEEYVRLSQPRNMEIPLEVFEVAYGCKPDISNIEPEYLEFAKKSMDSKATYCSANNSENEYLSQWCEEDAYSAGNKMEALFLS